MMKYRGVQSGFNMIIVSKTCVKIDIINLILTYVSYVPKLQS